MIEKQDEHNSCDKLKPAEIGKKVSAFETKVKLKSILRTDQKYPIPPDPVRKSISIMDLCEVRREPVESVHNKMHVDKLLL